ncbi:DUF4346 domain-containing protein [Candidatus Woesearchaeota archaeon]|nr:DUF4346 domain-containing protein [Candidatus Woesearchaeota archaeon]
MPKPKYRFYKQKERIVQVIRATYNSEKEWTQDPKGYFLIRIDSKKKYIEVGFSNNQHIITKKFTCKYAVELYHTLARKKIITRFEHAAYLGKELYKAELALKYGLLYRQDFPLQIPLKVKVKLEKES